MILVVVFFAMLCDGYDFAAIGYAAPELVKAWHVSRSALVPVFTAGLVGMLFGGPAIGQMGDRLGRRFALLSGLVIVGTTTLACAWATSLGALVALRFATGVGLGGIVPSVVALTAEVVPVRFRGRAIVLVGFGIPAGIALAGPVATTLVPRFGWNTLFAVGGLVPLTLVLPAWHLLRNRARTGVLHARGAADPSPPGSGSVKDLFTRDRAFITLLLWAAVAANQMTNFFAITWLPTLLQQQSQNSPGSSISASFFAVGGIAGGVTLTFLVDRFGAVPMVLLFCAGVPLTAAMCVPGLPLAASAAIIAGAGFCVTGNNFGINATLGAIYPPSIRAMGTGWAQAAGRLGSLTAPLVGGLLLEAHVPLREVSFAPAAVLAVGAVVWTMLTVACVRRFGGTRLRAFDDRGTAAQVVRQQTS